jgi:hypothetical protein
MWLTKNYLVNNCNVLWTTTSPYFMSLTYVPTTNTTASLNTMASNFISTEYSTVFTAGNIPTGYSATVNTLANILAASSMTI